MQTANNTRKMSRQPTVPQLILASESASRRQLLGQLRIPFLCAPAHIDETPLPEEDPEQLVERLARQKAEALEHEHAGAVIIGADQVALFDGEATSKPGSAERARAMLARYSGHSVVFLTGLCVLDTRSACSYYHLDRTRVVFRTLSPDEIARYVDADEPMACAGCFKVESLGPSLFDAIHSEDPSGLPGLPLIALSRFLRETGFRAP